MTETKRAGVVLWGLGALGSRVVKAFGAGVDDLEIIGAVDHDPRLAGKTLAAASPDAAAPDVPIHADLPSCLAALPRPRINSPQASSCHRRPRRASQSAWCRPSSAARES